MRLLFILICTFQLVLATAAYGQVDAASAEGVIHSVLDGVMQDIAQTPAARDGDVGALAVIVDRRFLPATNFERTARIATGDAWAGATAEQQRELAEQFQKLIVHVYATELTQLADRHVTFRFERGVTSAAGSDAIVHTHMDNSGEDDTIDYRLEKTGSGWRIYDINILGTWLSQIYRHQFAPALSKGGVAGLIASLKAHNARNEAN